MFQLDSRPPALGTVNNCPSVTLKVARTVAWDGLVKSSATSYTPAPNGRGDDVSVRHRRLVEATNAMKIATTLTMPRTNLLKN
jgi:hypothetical protein